MPSVRFSTHLDSLTTAALCSSTTQFTTRDIAQRSTGTNALPIWLGTLIGYSFKNSQTAKRFSGKIYELHNHLRQLFSVVKCAATSTEDWGSGATLAAFLIYFSSWILVNPVYAATITEDFNRADSSDLGANWDSGYFSEVRNCQIASDHARPGTTGTVCYETWNANSFSGDQTAQVTLTTFQGGDTSMSILLKAEAPGVSTTFYRCLINTAGAAQIRKYVDGSSVATLASTTGLSFSAGDEIKCNAESNVNLTLYQNGNSILNGSDSSSQLTGGRIGISIYNFTDGDAELDDFSGGDIAPPAPSGNKAQVVVIE